LNFIPGKETQTISIKSWKNYWSLF
jgi:hypothetical protein